MSGISKTYIGDVINGYLILEEIERDNTKYPNSQIKHNNRLFRCKHLESGVILNRTLICI